MSVRHIWVIRHGKSDHGNAGLRDHDRPLNARGRRDGDMLRDWFAAQADAPQWLWVSSALRAQQTAQYVQQATGAELVTQPSLYLSMPDTLLDTLAGTPQEVNSVAVVAHNPGLTYLVNQLGDSLVTDNLVTWGMAHFETEAEWPALQFGAAQLIELYTPRGIRAHMEA